MNIIVPTSYYQHHSADFSLDVPAEGFGGWKKSDLPLATGHTALAIMHAWSYGTREEYPGLHRLVEYIPRAEKISREVIPPVADAFRLAGMQVIHIADGSGYEKKYPGYRIAQALPSEETPRHRIEKDEVYDALTAFKLKSVNPGEENGADIRRAAKARDFHESLLPRDDEPIVSDSGELFALCQSRGINHLIYAGFAIDCCLLISPAGMLDMSRRGLLCSAIRQAVTAVENKETARSETVKQVALWRVALFFGFVYDDSDLIGALQGIRRRE